MQFFLEILFHIEGKDEGRWKDEECKHTSFECLIQPHQFFDKEVIQQQGGGDIDRKLGADHTDRME